MVIMRLRHVNITLIVVTVWLGADRLLLELMTRYIPLSSRRAQCGLRVAGATETDPNNYLLHLPDTAYLDGAKDVVVATAEPRCTDTLVQFDFPYAKVLFLLLKPYRCVSMYKLDFLLIFLRLGLVGLASVRSTGMGLRLRLG